MIDWSLNNRKYCLKNGTMEHDVIVLFHVFFFCLWLACKNLGKLIEMSGNLPAENTECKTAWIISTAAIYWNFANPAVVP